MAFLRKISKRYSCDLLFPPVLCDSWEKSSRSFGARRGLWQQEEEGRREGQWQGLEPGLLQRDGLCPLDCSSFRRGAGPSAVPAPAARGAAGEALPPPQSSHSVLRLAAVWPGEEIRDPALPVHARAGGAGHGPQPVRDAGGPDRREGLISAPSSSPLNS